jgi:hypothetical protein
MSSNRELDFSNHDVRQDFFFLRVKDISGIIFVNGNLLLTRQYVNTLMLP